MKFAIKDAANILMINAITKKPFLYSEDANTFELKISADSVYTKAKGAKSIAFAGEETAELKMEFEVIQFKHLAIMASSDVETAERHKVGLVKKVTAGADKKAKLIKIKAVEGSISAFKLDPTDGQEIVGKELKLTSSVVGDDTEIDFTTDETVKENDLILVYYMEEKAKIKMIKLSTKDIAPNFKIEADVAAKSYEGKMMALHLSIPNAKAKKNVELTLSTDNPSKFPMELDLFPDTNGEYGVLTFIDDSNASISSLVAQLDPSIKLKK